MYSQSENTNYYIKFPYTDKKNKPLKIWENLNEILEVNNISVMYNEIAKDIEIKGVEGSTLESQLIAIHSLSNKSGLPLSLNMINNFINKAKKIMLERYCELENGSLRKDDEERDNIRRYILQKYPTVVEKYKSHHNR